MNKKGHRIGVSVLAFATAMILPGAAALAQAPQAAQEAVTDEEATVEDIVVTGSSIRGVAPVGSNLVSGGQESLAKTGGTTTSRLVNTVPAITTAGSTPCCWAHPSAGPRLPWRSRSCSCCCSRLPPSRSSGSSVPCAQTSRASS